MADWQIDVATDASSDPALESTVESAVRATLEAEAAGDAEISVALVPDSLISEINLQYLGREGPTDVIAFPLEQPGSPLVGDIYIGLEQARRQAVELGVDAEEEVVRLAVHGTLHVLGWDHPEGEDRVDSPMFRRQEEIVRRLAGGS